MGSYRSRVPGHFASVGSLCKLTTHCASDVMFVELSVGIAVSGRERSC